MIQQKMWIYTNLIRSNTYLLSSLRSILVKCPHWEQLKKQPLFSTEKQWQWVTPHSLWLLHGTHKFWRVIPWTHSLFHISEQTKNFYKVLTFGQKIKCPIYTYIQTPLLSLLNSLVLKMAFWLVFKSLKRKVCNTLVFALLN